MIKKKKTQSARLESSASLTSQPWSGWRAQSPVMAEQVSCRWCSLGSLLATFYSLWLLPDPPPPVGLPPVPSTHSLPLPAQSQDRLLGFEERADSVRKSPVARSLRHQRTPVPVAPAPAAGAGSRPQPRALGMGAESAGRAGTFWLLAVLSPTELESFPPRFSPGQRNRSCVVEHVTQDVGLGMLK